MTTEKPESPAKAISKLPFRKRFVLVWRLLTDSRVPFSAKLVLPGVGLYLLFPFDLIPDFIPILGMLDDVLVIILGLWLFLRLAPRPVFDEHLQRLQLEAAEKP